MAWNEPPLPKGWDQPSSDPWAPPKDTNGLPDPWAEPDPEPDQLRRSLRRIRNGFSMIAIAVGLSCLSLMGTLAMFFTGNRLRPVGIVLGIPHWDLIEGSAVTWCSLIGAAMIWGRWPDESWRKRSGLFLMMCFVDLILWTLDHAMDLGLTDAATAVGHDWFRSSLGTALGFAEFVLIAGLASEMAARQGESGAIAFGKAARSLAITGGFVWLMYFMMRTNWRGPVWPLRTRPWKPDAFMIMLVTWVLTGINLLQLTILSLMASRSCGQTLRRMGPADTTSNDLLISPSDAAWRDFNDSRRANDRV